MNRILEMMQQAYETFEAAAASLLSRAKGDRQLCENLQAYFDTCRTFTTGHILWSLESKRYGLKQYLQADSSIIIPL